MQDGEMKIEYTEHSLHNNKNSYRMKQKYTKHTTIYTMIKKEPTEHEGI
jgi:hypothetical protein